MLTPVSHASPIPRAPRVLVLSSRVARGRVGLSAAQTALEALGCEVLALPTVQMASRPGLGRVAASVTPPDALAAMVEALDADGALQGLGAVLTGYAPTADHAEVMRGAIESARAASPDVRIVCDPVIGDAGRVYLDEAAARAVRTRVAPLADILTPNAFEMAWLMEDENAAKAGDLVRLAREHPAHDIVVTSAPAMLRGHLGTLLVPRDGTPTMIEAPAAPSAPNGTGDLFAALLTGRLAKGEALDAALPKAAASVHAIALRSHRAGAEHLLIVEERDEMIRPSVTVSRRVLRG